MEVETVRCAYDERHKMPKQRLESHYLICEAKRKRQHLYAVCPFNRMHHVTKAMLEQHNHECPNRRDDSNPIDDEIRQYIASLGMKNGTAVNKWGGYRSEIDCRPIEPSATLALFDPNKEDPWA